MPINTQLLREGRIILQRYDDPLNLKEVSELAKKIDSDILDNAAKPVHTISDARGLTKLPTNVLSASKLPFNHTVHPMAGNNVVVINNSCLGAIAELFSRLVPQHKLIMCKTMEAGWAEIDRILAEEAK